MVKFPNFHFAGKPHNFKRSYLLEVNNLPKIKATLKELNIENLILLEQVHGEDVLVIDTKTKLNQDSLSQNSFNFLANADAFFIENYQEYFSLNPNLSFGIITADCLPIFIVGKQNIAAIHAGWRGVANLLIDKVCQLFIENLDTEVKVQIGPSAGKDDYEVGQDVILELKKTCNNVAFIASKNADRFMLDLPSTALNKIRAYLTVEEASISENSTITNEEYYSFRREKERAGRNLSYIKTPLVFLSY